MTINSIPLRITWVGHGHSVQCGTCGQWVTGKGSRGTKHDCPKAPKPTQKRQASVPPTEEA